MFYSGGTPFFEQGGGELLLGGTGITDEGFGEARLSLIPVVLDWVLGTAVGSEFPILAMLSSDDWSRAWFPLGEINLYYGMNGPAFVCGLDFNSVPMVPGDERAEYGPAIPAFAGVGLPLYFADAVLLAPSATVGWSLYPDTGLYYDARLVAKVHVGESVGVFTRVEYMHQNQTAGDVDGTLVEVGATIWTGSDW